MENSDIRRRKIKAERRKEKAERINQSASSDGGGGASGEVEGAPPAKKRKIKKKSAVYEDIIDGFAIRSYKTYEDLTVSVKLNLMHLFFIEL